LARNVIKETDYEFVPAESSVYIYNRYIPSERLMLITNVTKGIVIYNFSDPNLGLNDIQRIGNAPIDEAPLQDAGSPNWVGTEIYFKYNCSQMDPTDKLQIMVDDPDQVVSFEESMLDGAQKLRVSQPQSLIDTDFEYSIQPSKWESLFLNQNYPAFFAKPGGGNSLLISSIVGDGTSPKSTMTVTCSVPHGLSLGNIVSVQETLNYRAEGTFAINKINDIYSFTYVAKGTISGDVNYGNLSAVYAGDVYDSAHIPGGSYPAMGTLTNYTGVVPNSMQPWAASSDNAYPFSTVTVTFTNPHGLFPGTPISITGTNSFDGDYYVLKVPTVRTLQVQVIKQVPSIVVVPSTARIIAKGEGYVIHRPYDAGVALAAQLPNPGVQIIRQTRRYFRYQAGKAMQFSTGAKFTPTYSIDSMSMDSGAIGLRTITVQTVEDHGLQIDAEVLVEGVDIQTPGLTNPYNGIFIVTGIPDSNSFQYKVTTTQVIPFHDQKSAGPNMYAHAYRWYGAATRTGMFDDQNGFWFEYDGQEFYVCRRHSEKLIQGRSNVTQYSNLVTGVGTLYREQLVANDMIVIKGASYKILQVNSDTSLTISPAYRGPSNNGVRITKTQIERIAQDEWNMDKIDGTGPSGYILDITKMQMVFIDYSWYGAGTIRFGLRANNGKIIYVHKMPQNNKNALAYQKSGNLPARYEVSTEPIQNTRMIAGASGSRGSTLTPSGTRLYVENVHDWPATGYLWVKDDVNCELMKYTAIGNYDATVNGYPLTIQRRQSITYAYPDKTYSFSGTTAEVTFQADSSFTGTGGNAQVAVQTIGITCAPIIQHWGSSVIEDGFLQSDLLPVFTGGMTKYMSVAPGISRPMLALRLAPSVDNAIGRNYGFRELTNRMQLALKSIGIQTNGSFRIDVLMNPAQIFYSQWNASQLAIVKASTNVSISNGSTSMTIATSDTQGMVGLVPGMGVSGTNIPASTVINSINGNIIAMSNAATGNSSANYTFTPTTASTYTGLPNDWAKDSVGVNSLAQVLYFDNSGSGQGQVPITYTKTASGGANGALTFTVTDSTGIVPGQVITGGTGIASNAIVTRVDTTNNTVYVDKTNTGTVSGTITFGSTTYPVSPSGSINGGDSVFSFFTENGSTTSYNSSVYDLSGIRELGNSILSGNGNISTPGFPMGPDVLVVQATNIGTGAANVSARVSWTEAQA
jgi:hypothetical protein